MGAELIMCSAEMIRAGQNKEEADGLESLENHAYVNYNLNSWKEIRPHCRP